MVSYQLVYNFQIPFSGPILQFWIKMVPFLKDSGFPLFCSRFVNRTNYYFLCKTAETRPQISSGALMKNFLTRS